MKPRRVKSITTMKLRPNPRRAVRPMTILTVVVSISISAEEAIAVGLTSTLEVDHG